MPRSFLRNYVRGESKGPHTATAPPTTVPRPRAAPSPHASQHGCSRPPLTRPPPRGPAAYGFALLKFQLSSEKKDFNLAPLTGTGPPAPPARDAELPHSKRSSASGYDPEAHDEPWPAKAGPHSSHQNSAYSSAATTPGLGKRHPPTPQETARPLGPLPVPGRYMARYHQPGAGGGLPAGAAVDEGMFPMMTGRSEQDTAEMAATMEQIQALNAQLTDMIGGKVSSARLSYSEDAEPEAGGGGPASPRRQGSQGMAGEAYAV